MMDHQFSSSKLVYPVHPIRPVHAIKAERTRSLCFSVLFSGISEHDCAHIASAAVRRTFARRETLFTQGEEVRNLILLQSGNVKHTQVSPDGDEVLLRISSAGDIVYVQGLSSIRCHTCSGRATEECHALVWEHDQMRNYLAVYPRLGVNMTRILVAQLNELEERFREVASERLTKRLALLLLRLSRQMGRQSGNGTKIVLSRQEIAQMAGVTIFSISRMLSRWSEQGLILTAREAVIICDPGRLELMAGSSKQSALARCLVSNRHFAHYGCEEWDCMFEGSLPGLRGSKPLRRSFSRSLGTQPVPSVEPAQEGRH
jgi:CRP-like cAMP-binding protein